MLSVRRCLEVEDGSHVYLDPALHVTWPEAFAVVTAARRLRAVYHDQRHVLSRGEAAALIDAGLAVPAGARLMERPELSRTVFGWDASSELDFITDQLTAVAQGQRGIEYGCGYGRLLLPLRERGFALDGIDAAESTVRWLNERPECQAADQNLMVMVGDIAECAFPGRYGYALCGLNTLRYLPHLASARRHLHLAALSVRPGGRYVVFVDSWTDDAQPAQPSSAQEWHTTGPANEQLRVVWSVVRHDPASKMCLESVVVHAGDQEIIREYHPQLALSLGEWRNLFEEREQWRVRTVWLDDYPTPRPLAELTEPTNGNFWFVLERMSTTADALFTR